MEKKRFAVIGLGKFGFYLAKELAASEHNIICIDRNEKLVEEISEYVTEAVVADARRREVLKDLNMDEMDTVIVAVGTLTQSVLITLYLKEMGCRYILAKASDEDHATLLSLVGASKVIIPEKDMALRIAQKLTMPNVVDFMTMLPEFCLVEVSPPEKFLGKSLAELDLRNKYNIFVIGIRHRDSDKIELMPGADHKILEGDSIYVLTKKSDLEKLTEITGKGKLFF
ncbi:MAG: TrkA family potassium uptake protein [Thermodesulfatator sp.]|nr:MAG: TrkA family potassium uptake protein [Thermodesulfatator sp.]